VRALRVTTAGMMLGVAVVAVDFFLIVDVFYGVLLIGLALNLGLVRMARSHGRKRRFWAGFEATGLAMLLAFIACFEAFGEVVYAPVGAFVYALIGLQCVLARLPMPTSVMRFLEGWIAAFYQTNCVARSVSSVSREMEKPWHSRLIEQLWNAVTLDELMVDIIPSEVAIGLPMLLIALAGGLLAMKLRRGVGSE
jgi:hypothetical protein